MRFFAVALLLDFSFLFCALHFKLLGCGLACFAFIVRVPSCLSSFCDGVEPSVLYVNGIHMTGTLTASSTQEC